MSVILSLSALISLLRKLWFDCCVIFGNIIKARRHTYKLPNSMLLCVQHAVKQKPFQHRLFPSAELCKSARAVLWILCSAYYILRQPLHVETHEHRIQPQRTAIRCGFLSASRRRSNYAHTLIDSKIIHHLFKKRDFSGES